ncbi:hypothetical protein PRIPAC_72324, partial [Pristionchus pacificus]|uniref:Uncharacterized protein n=1 Tax=Pristionchus pacificus TaxID=54126 RepID=A0A8R1UAE4_PRIPA
MRAKQRGHQIGNTIATETVSDDIMSLVEDEIIVIDHCESHHHDQKEEMRQREAQNMVNPSSTIRKQSLNLPARILELRAKQRGLEIGNPVTTEIAVDQSLNPSSTVRNLPLPSGILEARAHAKRQEEGKICLTASEETVEIPSPMILEKASTQTVCNIIDTLVNPPVNDPIDVPSTSKSAKSTQTSTVEIKVPYCIIQEPLSIFPLNDKRSYSLLWFVIHFSIRLITSNVIV